MEILHYLSSRGNRVEQHLDHLVTEREGAHQSLFHAVRYSLLGAGKRLRPVLTLATAEALGGRSEQALTPACAIEMVHTYSLIHDDLPCMDNDDYRRGKPTLHKAFPESHAVLAGDFLLTYAFEIIANDSHLDSEQKVKVISSLSHKAGGEGMIAGQIMDIEAEGRSIDSDLLRQIHLRKTGALIAAAVECGGIIAKGPDPILSKLRSFGFEVGLAFQIIDDVLDITSTQDKLGKTIGSDRNNCKTTYATLFGAERATEMADSLLDSAISTLNQMPYDTSLLKQLALYVAKRET